jgi:hypothetical protein
MTRNVQFIVGLAAILLVLGFCWTARNLRPSVPPRKLSALFIGMTNNVTRTMGPPRVEVCGGASGTFALFLVTNTTRHDFLWFKTAAVEKKTPAGWQPFIPTSVPWSGPQGRLWSPGYGCLLAVGWPPGLPTNAYWRLQLTYGRDPGALGILINQESGREFFHSGKAENTIPSSEVNP